MSLIFSNNLSKSNFGSFAILVIILLFIFGINTSIYFLFNNIFGDNHYGLIYFLDDPIILICFLCMFAVDFFVLFILRRIEFSELSYKIIMALINFTIVSVSVTLLFGQLYNVEKIEVENEKGERYNLLVAKLPHYDVISNPIEGNKDFILEQKNTLDVLKNLDDDTKAENTLPRDTSKLVKITSVGNMPILIQILLLFSFTAPRLLMPFLLQRKKGDPHYLNSDN